ncbi:patched domain-containing protein 3-like [Branchiostoma lanceolatum]|uniref:patched domain-containing protein 3-like n=1 Tax=Branchiostoma lanceolatum TaxID=7740 RepID=UPI0034568AA8
MINTENLTSPVRDQDFKVTDNLGGLLRDENGRIIQAGAAMMWYAAQTSNGKDDTDEFKEIQEAWEIEFVNAVNEESVNSGNNITLFPSPFSSAVLDNNTVGDVPLLMAGCCIILVYVICQLGQFNRLQHKVYLTLVGVLCIGLAIAGGIGLCLLLGLTYNYIHSMLPFLILGIGVDDMFVIVTTWNNLTPEQKTLDVRQQAALTLSHAGVSITVTSLTDIASFGIGATTIIPGLQSFCIFATVSIFLVFVYSCTIFMAALVLDLRRLEERRDACCFVRLDTQYEPSACSQQDLLQLFFQNIYSPVLMKTPVKILVAVATVGLFSASMVGTISLEQEFDYIKHMTDYESGLAKYTRKVEQYYPDDGAPVHFYIGDIDYYHERDKLKALYEALDASPFLKEGSVTSWYHDFGIWINSNKNQSLLEPDGFPEDISDFYLWLIEFLVTDGKHQIMNVRFRPELESILEAMRENAEENEEDEEEAAGTSEWETNEELEDLLALWKFLPEGAVTPFVATRLETKCRLMETSQEEIAAMNSLYQIADNMEFSSTAFPFSIFFSAWQTDEVIQEELFRNIGLGLAVVLMIGLLLLADIVTCFWVFICVSFTLVDVMGMMHFWGVEINIVSSILVIVALGLSVDYAAHLGVMFLTLPGTKQERASKSLGAIGPAVFNGGFSTLLAVVVLSGSSSYTFNTFFKVFFLVVLFGLWHGLVFLPVLLSWFGPDYQELASKHTAGSKERKTASKKKRKITSLWERETSGPSKEKKCAHSEGGRDVGNLIINITMNDKQVITSSMESTSFQVNGQPHLPEKTIPTQVDPPTNNTYSSGIPKPDYDDAPTKPPTAGEGSVPVTTCITGQSENAKISVEIKITKG